MGGGMGAGKSTFQKEILKEYGFWAEAAENVVVVEADAFKETHVIYRALISKGHHNDMLQTAELGTSINAFPSSEGKLTIVYGKECMVPLFMCEEKHLMPSRLTSSNRKLLQETGGCKVGCVQQLTNLNEAVASYSSTTPN
ncbi:Zeta toxin domain [Artemisia annua]|uniref:Zeta toxin domain n=1 Tax=Artemisia annua TaxID=35608 RepID=A0A2U1MXD9_ARTAN|nr:Zeta toxin domain [Artemisia annua]